MLARLKIFNVGKLGMKKKKVILIVALAVAGLVASLTYYSFRAPEKKTEFPNFETPKDTTRTLIDAYNRRDIGAYQNCFSKEVLSALPENKFQHYLDVAENWSWKLGEIVTFDIITNTVNSKAWGIVGVSASGVSPVENFLYAEKGEGFTEERSRFTFFVNEENKWKIDDPPGLFQPIYYLIIDPYFINGGN